MRILTLCMIILGALALISSPCSVASAEDKKLDLVICNPEENDDDYFTTDIDNPFIMYDRIGRQWRLTGEEDDEQVIVRITVLNAAEIDEELQGTEIFYGNDNENEGIETLVVEELEAVDEPADDEDGEGDGIIQPGEVTEQSFNYYAQIKEGDWAGTVCYFGEVVFEPEEVDENGNGILEKSSNNTVEPEPGVIVEGLVEVFDGAWRADTGDNTPGIYFPAEEFATPGTMFQQENGLEPLLDAPDDEDFEPALDEMKIVGSQPVTFESLVINGVEFEEITSEDTRRGREFNPVDGEKGYKTFGKSFGILLDEEFALIELEVPEGQ